MFPQASLAPRPMMPRCASLPASSAEARDTYPGSPPRLANVAPSHGGGGGSGGSTWFAPLRSLSVPLINTTHTCSEAAGTETTLSSGEAWLALQREMGTFKVDNRGNLHLRIFSSRVSVDQTACRKLDSVRRGSNGPASKDFIAGA